MAKSFPQLKPPISRGKRYSLRTLFIVSGVIAAPFLLLANLRHSVRPEESVASPLYLVLGVAAVVLAAAIGSALGSTPGMVAAAGLAAISWIAVVLLGGVFSKELMAVLPAHIVGSVGTLAVLAYVARSAKMAEDDATHHRLLKLLQAKRDVRSALDFRGKRSPIADDRAPKSD
jgi:hypothetical protein